jgi:Sec-independent protein translocase protein TatA
MSPATWVLIAVVVLLLLDDIHLRVAAARVPERDAHGRFRKHGQADPVHRFCDPVPGDNEPKESA